MKRKKVNVILADCEKEEVSSLLEGLQEESEEYVIKSHIANWKRTGKISELKRYIKYFQVGFHYFIHRKECGIMIGWQQFYALIYCFFCEIFHVKKENIVIALNFTYKAKKGRVFELYRWFMNKCLSSEYMDYLHVLSETYADAISNEFGFPRERILVTPFGVPDFYDKWRKYIAPYEYEKEKYALAIGRSNRDYDFLIRAWKNIDYPLVIISDTFQEKVDAKNIKIITNIAGEESYPWIVNCGLMIIPIQDGDICSGDTVLLNAMACKRKILVTKPSTLAEMYIINGENAVLTEKDEEKFEKNINEMLYTDKYKNLGEKARNSFLEKYSRNSMGQKIGHLIKTRTYFGGE